MRTPRAGNEKSLSDITIRNNPARLRFEVLDSDSAVGQAAYVDDGASHRIFYHTVIEDGYGGQGLAGRLAAQALDETVAAGLKIVPVCPYIKKYLGEHAGYEAMIQKPTPALLAVLKNALGQDARG
ncbi:MAG TPA: GNAT family N-acetyltransferase [Arthrobacter sp.]